MCSGMANVSKVATDFLQWDIKLLWMMWVLCLPDESNVMIYSITSCLTEGWQWPLEVGETTLLCCKKAQRNICAVTTVQLQLKPLCFVHIACQFVPLSIVGTRTGFNTFRDTTTPVECCVTSPIIEAFAHMGWISNAQTYFFEAGWWLAAGAGSLLIEW